MADRVIIRVADPDHRIIGQVDQYTYLDSRIRINEVGTWQLTVPTFENAYQASLLVPGNDVIVTLDGEVFSSGPVRMVTEPLVGLKVVEGVDDMVWLAARLAYPQAPSLDTATNYSDDRSGAAEDVLYAYIDANAGPGAAVGRRAVRLRTSQGRGSTVSESARFDVLLDLCKRILAVDGFGMRCRIDLSDLGAPYVEVVVPRDRRGAVEFSTFRGNIAGESTRIDEAPIATVAVVGGEGEGTARSFVTRQNPSQEAVWGRYETFVDARDSADAAVLAQRGDEQIQPAGPTLKIVHRETEGTRYRDWQLGDLVNGQVLGAVEDYYITELQLEHGSAAADPRLSPTLTSAPSVRADQLALLVERVQALESHQ